MLGGSTPNRNPTQRSRGNPGLQSSSHVNTMNKSKNYDSNNNNNKNGEKVNNSNDNRNNSTTINMRS